MSIHKPKSSRYKILQSIIALALITFIAISCNDVNTSSIQNGKAHINVRLTDAPADYQEVNIDVQGLRIHFTPGSTDTTDSDSLEDGKWIDLPVEPMQVNLLELQNGVDTLLASADLNPGTYKELRLVLGENNNVVVDSTTQNLKVPSGQSSGYKIKFETELEEGEELDLVIDFDASRSVHKAGNSGKFILKPVLRAFVENGDNIETGSILGIVEPAEARPNIFAIMGDDTAATSQADTTGSFLLQGLQAGTYNLSFEPDSEQFSDTTLTGVAVLEGEKTDIGTVTLNEN